MTLSTTTGKTNGTTHRNFTGIGSLMKVWSQRQSLNRLDDAALNDIGLARAEAETEARRSFWDVPEPWHIWDESKTWRIWGASKTWYN